jgi:hypothetical protein
MAAEHWWDFHQMDAFTVLSNGEIKDGAFMEQPTGYRVWGKVWKLKKTLYGLSTAPAIWYRIQAAFLNVADRPLSVAIRWFV